MTDDETSAVIWAMEPRDRMGALVCTIVEMADRKTLPAVQALLAAAVLMARVLPADTRINLAEEIRTIADNIEHGPTQTWG